MDFTTILSFVTRSQGFSRLLHNGCSPFTLIYLSNLSKSTAADGSFLTYELFIVCLFIVINGAIFGSYVYITRGPFHNCMQDADKPLTEEYTPDGIDGTHNIGPISA